MCIFLAPSVYCIYFASTYKMCWSTHWPALVSALTYSLVDLQDELQLFVGAEGGERAVHPLTCLPCLPVILPSLIHLVTAWSLLIVVPSTRAFFYTRIHSFQQSAIIPHCITQKKMYTMGYVLTLMSWGLWDWHSKQHGWSHTFCCVPSLDSSTWAASVHSCLRMHMLTINILWSPEQSAFILIISSCLQQNG